MENTNVKTRSMWQLALLDAVLLTTACLVPAASHLTQVRLFLFNPMIALLLAGMLLGRDWRNALVLAVLMPAVSCMLVGMPTAAKAVCMAAQFATIAGVFGLLQRKWNVLPAVLVALVAGTAVYYGAKVLLTGMLFGSDSLMLAAASLLWALLFAMLYPLTNKR